MSMCIRVLFIILSLGIFSCGQGSNIESGFLGGIDYSVKKSVVILDPDVATDNNADIAPTQTVDVTLTVKDQNGRVFRAPKPLNVSFSLSGGTSTGTFSDATDNGDGTYTSTFTAVQTGTSSKVKAAINNKYLETDFPTITVYDPSGLPIISAADITVTEGSNAEFTVGLSHASTHDVTVDYSTSNSTGTAGTHYTSKSGTLTIVAGSLSRTISVPTHSDGVYHLTGRTFKLNLSSPTRAVIGDASAIATISNTDAAPTVQFSTATQSVNHIPSPQILVVTAQLSAASDSDVVVPLLTSGTAASGVDYSLSSANLTISAGSTTGYVTLTATDSGTIGSDQSAVLTMDTPSGASLGAITEQTVTIVNNNYPAVDFDIASQDIPINLGTATVTVSLNTAPVKAVTVPITVDGSSTAGYSTHYEIDDATLEFAAGETTKTLTLTILDQKTPTPSNATVVLEFGALTNATAGGSDTHTLTIREPSLDLNFAALFEPTTQMSQAPYNQITFTRNSVGSYTDADGLVKYVAPGVMRIDHNPITGQPNGLLIERTRTNILIQSSITTEDPWHTNNSATALANSEVLTPEGSYSGIILIPTGSQGNWRQSVVIPNDSVTRVASVFAKPEDPSTSFTIDLWYSGGTSKYYGARFDFSTATFSNITAGAEYGAIPYSNGWYRLWIAAPNTSSGNTRVAIELYVHGSGRAVNLWGAQLEEGSVPTSYIPTTINSVTRATDEAVINPISSWYDTDSSSLYTEFYKEFSENNYPRLFHFSDGTSNNFLTSYNHNTNVSLQVNEGGNLQGSPYAGSMTPGQTVRAAFGIEDNNLYATIDNKAGASDTSATVPANIDRLYIGQLGGGNNPISGSIGRLTYFPTRWSNDYLKTLTDNSTQIRTYTPTVNLTRSAQSVVEIQGTVYVTAALDEPAGDTITVPYTVAGTAASGTHYTGLASGNLTFSAGESRQTLSFELLDDGTPTDKTITITLGSGVGFNLGSTPTQTITISRPTLDLNFASIYNPSTQFSSAPFDEITFSRASTATYFDADGLLKIASANIPRIDHDPMTGQPRGLLIEESRTNLVSISSEFNNGDVWSYSNLGAFGSNSKSNTTETRAPDGSFTADLVVEDTATSTHYLTSKVINVEAGEDLAGSFFLKPKGRTFIRVDISNNDYSIRAGYAVNLSTGEYTPVATGGATALGFNLETLPNGWYRAKFATNLGASVSSVKLRAIFLTSLSNTSWAGDGASGFYFWGAQLEQGNFSSSYIPTSSGASMRAADSANINSLATWYNEESGSTLLQAQTPIGIGGLGDSRAVTVYKNGSNRLGPYVLADGQLNWYSPTYTTLKTGFISLGESFNSASAWAVDDLAATSHGWTPALTYSGSPIDSDGATLNIGHLNETRHWNASIRRITYYGARLPNNILQSLSSATTYSPRILTPEVNFTRSSQSVLEETNTVRVIAAIDEPASSNISVPYTVSGTAVSGTDYSGLSSGTLTFDAGESRALLTFEVESTVTSGRTVVITMGAPTGATLGANISQTITLGDSTGLSLDSPTEYNNDNNSYPSFTLNCVPGLLVTASTGSPSSFLCPDSGVYLWTSTTPITVDGTTTITFTQTDGISTITTDATWVRDTTAPTNPTVLDGHYTSTTTSSPATTWSSSTDTGGSGVDGYEVALGSTAGAVDIEDWSAVGTSLTHTFNGLTLVNGETYYVSVRAIDRAGNVSGSANGDGFTVITDTPALDLDFSTGTLPLSVQFSREFGASTSPGTYFNESGTLVTSSPRNLLRYSRDFTNGAWAKGYTTVEVSPETGPDGLQTAYFLKESTANNQHYLYQPLTVTPGQPYSMSIYVKGSDRCLNLLSHNATDGNQGNSIFDLSSGTRISGSGSISAANSGWYRVETTFTPSIANITFQLKLLECPLGWSYAGNGTSGLHIWGAQLEEGSDVTPQIHTTNTSAYAARFDHDPTPSNCPSGVCNLRGLLFEETRTNLLTYSEEIDQTAQWGTVNASISTDTVVAPDGNTTADVILESTATSTQHGIGETGGTISLTDDSDYTASVFAKAEGRNYFRIKTVNNAGSGPSTMFNLSSGTVTFSNTGHTKATITQLKNGWYRCSVTFNSGSGGSTPHVQIWVSSDGTTSSYAGDVTKGVAIWGLQLEKGAFATSYIPTTTTTLTRNLDVATVPDLPTWFNNTQGALFIEGHFTGYRSGSYPNLAIISDGTSDNNISLMFDALYPRLRHAIKSGGSTQMDTFSDAFYYTLGNTFKMSLSYTDNDFAATADGDPVATDNNGSVPLGLNTFAIGKTYTGWLHHIQYFNSRLTDTQIQMITGP